MNATPLMTRAELIAAWDNPQFMFRHPRVPEDRVTEQSAQDMIHLRMKITYALGHHDKPIQVHPVEGWTTKEVLVDYMVNTGRIKREFIVRDIGNRKAALGEKRHLVSDDGATSPRGALKGVPLGSEDESHGWATVELRALVQSYLETLRFQNKYIGFQKLQHVKDLRDSTFAGRSKEEVELGLKSVSAVLAQRDLPWLQAYKPTATLEPRISNRIGAILTENGFVALDIPPEREVEPSVTDPSNKLPSPIHRETTPPGNPAPERVVCERIEYLCDQSVRAWVLENSNGTCEVCHAAAPFLDDWDTPFLEVHHVKPLAGNGTDTIDNAVAICPNCHRRFHHAKDRVDFAARSRSRR